MSPAFVDLLDPYISPLIFPHSRLFLSPISLSSSPLSQPTDLPAHSFPHGRRCPFPENTLTPQLSTLVLLGSENTRASTLRLSSQVDNSSAAHTPFPQHHLPFL